MNNTHMIYNTLTVFCAGIIVYAVLQLAYVHFKISRKETLAPLLISCAALVYIISDVLASSFSFMLPVNDPSRFIIIKRELSLMLFIIAGPLYVNQVLGISETFRKINRVIILTGIVTVIITSAATVYDPGLFITTGSLPGIVYQARDMGSLLIFRDILMTVFMIYSTGLVLYCETRRNKSFPESRLVKSVLIGFIIMCYFVFSYLYSILFSRNPMESSSVIFPHFGLGITIFIVFMTGGLLDVLIEYRTQFIKVKKDLKQLVYYDAFLGIPNRTSFIRDIESKIKGIKAGNGAFSVLFLDIDDFQRLNECYGERVGDEVLKSFSGRLIEIFSRTGTIYRIGVDDFALLMSGIHSEKRAKDIAGKIITSLRSPFLVNGVSCLVTASIGILRVPQAGDNSEAILKNAFSVVRVAKKTKNAYEVFSREMQDGLFNKINQVNVLRDSIHRKMFTLFYQPIVDINEKLVCAEALLRCTNTDASPPIGGPSMFIPLIEEAGLMKDIDNMVIRMAFHDMEMYIKNSFQVSINLSTNQLINPGYGDFLTSFASQHSIENRHILLEVTENLLMENLSVGRESLKVLRDRGFKIAIDDFGTGFSSLAYLAELPIDFIKIDMVFVQSVPGDVKREAMARHIVELSNSQSMKVIAEGIETREQFNFFRELGCDLFQGFLFSRPKPLREIITENYIN